MDRTSQIMANPQLKSFTSQIIFLAHQLIRYSGWDNCTLSLEKIGDFGVEGEEREIIELKNADSPSNNPLSNASLDLWKSIYNWTYYFYEHQVLNTHDYRLLLFVVTKNNCPTDIIELIAKCNNLEKFKVLKSCIEERVIKNKIGRRKTIEQIKETYKDKRPTAKYYAELLFSKELSDYFQKVVYQFQYHKADNDYLTALLNVIENNYGCTNRAICEDIAIKLLGWISKLVSELLATNKVVTVDTSEYFNFTKTYIGPILIQNKYKAHPNLLPSRDELNEEINKSPQYIKQLDIINFDSDIIQDAAYYYLKLLMERKNWVESGYLDTIEDPKYLAYQESIIRNWRIVKGITQSTITETERGKAVYNNLQFNNKNTLFDGECLEDEITRGFIQELAQIDIESTLSIGWHPEYKRIIKEEKNE
jgi:hypothetical protein